METKIIKKDGEKFLLKEEECSQIYMQTDKLIFTISTLLLWQKACLDKGRKGADEVCYVTSGTILMHLPGLRKIIDSFITSNGDTS